MSPTSNVKQGQWGKSDPSLCLLHPVRLKVPVSGEDIFGICTLLALPLIQTHYHPIKGLLEITVTLTSITFHMDVNNACLYLQMLCFAVQCTVNMYCGLLPVNRKEVAHSKEWVIYQFNSH